ncbi:MAG: amidohydrolase [bacterium]|nr:amidohydrolase [bacterium]
MLLARSHACVSVLVLLFVLAAPTSALARANAPTAPPFEDVTVFVAKQIVTMEPGQPEATAVAVDGETGRIIDVGSLDTMAPWLEDVPHTIDRQFRKQVLLPGFVDPHVHPFLAGKLLTVDIAAPEAWNLPSGRVESVTNREDFVARLKTLSAAWPHDDVPQIVWGWHRLWHGDFGRDDLDAIAPDKPLLLWHRSYHEIVANSKAMAMIPIPDEALERFGNQIDLERGHFAEMGMGVANMAIAPITETPEKIEQGLETFRVLMQRGGLTTAADMVAGSTIGIDVEWDASKAHLQGEDVPFRTLFIHAPAGWQIAAGEAAVTKFQSIRAEANDQLRWPKAIKSLADGAFISQLMRMGPPGYLDGHEGEWMIPPELQYGVVEPWWKQGFDVYYHVNGDEGLDVVLDVFERLKAEHPRSDFRFSLEHFGMSRDDQVERFARLGGGSVSINGYYAHYFADKYARHGLGYARASQMTRLGSLSRAGIPFTMHSDCPMGPLEPLLAVTTAVTRRTQEGRIMAPEQRVTVDEALRAVTIDAAWNLRLDDEVGSIAPGKKADFVVLEKNPYDVRPARIKDIGVWGTVYEGRVFEAP